MTISKTATNSNKVSAHIKRLEAPIAATTQLIRQIILSTDKEIGEQIKWNSPCFYYNGPMKSFDPKEYKRDILVLNLHKGNILLVFPTGAKVNDTSGLLEGSFPDGRRLVRFKDMDDVKAKQDSLKKIIADWLKLVERN
nr:DUF1801 domain-containing protein [Pedobacter panaciterrae]